MRILLTGSTGLIGSAIYRELSGAMEITRVGRRDSNEIYGDFSLPESIDALDLSNVDAVIHCAGVIDEDFAEDSHSAFLRSTVGLLPLVRNAAKAGVSRFVYFSTAHVYGPMEGVISEDSHVNPLSDYAIAHYAAEQIIRRYAASTDLTAMVVRPNAVFGIPTYPDLFSRWHLIPFSFPLNAIRLERIELRSPGEQVRNFISTEDLAGYVGRFLEIDEHCDKYTVVNPVGPSSFSVYEFAKKCLSVCREITGVEGDLIAPAVPLGSVVEPETKFMFETRHSFYSPSVNVEGYIGAIIRRAIKEDRFGEDKISG